MGPRSDRFNLIIKQIIAIREDLMVKIEMDKYGNGRIVNESVNDYANRALTDDDCSVIVDNCDKLKYHFCQTCDHKCKKLHCEHQHTFENDTKCQYLSFLTRLRRGKKMEPENWVCKFKKQTKRFTRHRDKRCQQDFTKRLKTSQKVSNALSRRDRSVFSSELRQKERKHVKKILTEMALIRDKAIEFMNLAKRQMILIIN